MDLKKWKYEENKLGGGGRRKAFHYNFVLQNHIKCNRVVQYAKQYVFVVTIFWWPAVILILKFCFKVIEFSSTVVTVSDQRFIYLQARGREF